MQIREKAKAHALEAIELQRADFERWGIMADWGQVYHTMSPQYEACVIKVFQEMADRGTSVLLCVYVEVCVAQGWCIGN